MASDSVTLLVGILGFIGGLLASFGLHYLERKESREKLREALYAEVQASASELEELDRLSIEVDEGRNPQNIKPHHTQIPTAVYDKHISDIGLLSRDEVAAVVDYYSIVAVAKEQLSKIDDDSTKKWFLNETVPPLAQRRKDAEDEIAGAMSYQVPVEIVKTILLIGFAIAIAVVLMVVFIYSGAIAYVSLL